MKINMLYPHLGSPIVYAGAVRAPVPRTGACLGIKYYEMSQTRMQAMESIAAKEE
jgi:hypothetical protein